MSSQTDKATERLTGSEPELIARIRATQKLTGIKQRWKLADGRTINLLTLDELEGLKREIPKTRLVAIDGSVCTAAEADDDTRYGYTAYGLDDDTTP